MNACGGLVLIGLVACSSTAAPSRALVAAPAAAAKSSVHRVAPPPPAFPRLPRNFVPISYRAHLVIGDRIGGHIEIVGDLKAASSVIWLHGADLDVISAKATRDSTSVDLDVAHTHWHNWPDELLALQPDHPLAPGRWTVSVEYTAEIAEQSLMTDKFDDYGNSMNYGEDVTRGAFREVVDGAPYVFTQFEPMHARRVFPCIDEPDLKVPWQLTLDVSKEFVAASNTAIAHETTLDDGRKRVEFAPTLPLPSYLIAFAVGPFEIVDAGKTKSGVPIRVLMQRGAVANAAVPVETTARVLDLLEDWFQIPYPYAKLDLVAVPQTGERWGAMENPGLITFNAWMVNPKFKDNDTRREWVQVASHELAHQWFGDLVTHAWWNDIWLNESFATWMSSKITAQFDPKWNGEQLAFEQRRRAMLPSGRDHKVSAVRAPMDEADTPGLLAAYLNGERGAPMIRMIEAFVGPERFQRAIRAYIRKHANGNATSSDLIAAVNEESGQSLDSMFADFLDKPSVPEITTEVRCGHGRSTLQLWSTPLEEWTVPICFAYDKDGARAQDCVVLDHGAKEVPLASKACPRWVMPNASGAGFYRTKWSAPALTALIDHGWNMMTPAERSVILSEASGELDLLAIAPKLIDAGDSVSLNMGVRLLGSDARFVPDDLRPRFNAWVQKRLGSTARAVHFKFHDHDEIETQRAQIEIVKGIIEWYRRNREELFKKYPKIQECEHDGKLTVDTREVLYKFCPSSSEAKDLGENYDGLSSDISESD